MAYPSLTTFPGETLFPEGETYANLTVLSVTDRSRTTTITARGRTTTITDRS